MKPESKKNIFDEVGGDLEKLFSHNLSFEDSGMILSNNGKKSFPNI